MTDKLMAVERGEIKRLMIFLPPRHSKSENSTIHFPAWYMLKHPDRRVMILSYSASLAQDFSRRTRAIVREFGPRLFGIEISDESSAVEQWALKGHFGVYVGAGIGGGITGRGSWLTIIDDPVKSAEEANSPTYRQRVWDWYVSAVYTRLEPNGAVVLTLTRWHEDDLAGRLLREAEDGGDKWEVVRIPAVAESEDDQLGRTLGEPIWPERYGVQELERLRRVTGEYVWSALYQQRPQSLEGGAFKARWFKWYTRNEVHFDTKAEQWTFRGEPLRIFQGVDPAISEKTAADDFVLVTVGITPTHKVVVLDVWHGHLEFTEQPRLVVQKYQEWQAERVGIEDNAYQAALAQAVIKDALVPVRRLTHHGDKYTRIMTMTPFFENGQVYFRAAVEDENGWTDQTRLPDVRIHPKFRKMYEQLVTYGPKAAHDDIADAMQNCFDVARPRVNPNDLYV